MNILLTNDDGIDAKGLHTLYDTIADLGNVTVVAPEHEMSGSSHSISMTYPLVIRQVMRNGSPWGVAVSGTPSDAAKLALTALFPEPPDLVISGINQGVNTGLAAIYSGTVAAASEGAFLAIPSMAVSLASRTYNDYKPAARIARKLATLLADPAHHSPKGTVWNINVPPLPLTDIKGFRLTRQGLGGFRDTFVRRTDPKGREYFWLDGAGFRIENDPMADDFAINDGYVTITPLSFDLTNRTLLKSADSWLADIRMKDLQ
jgi:5'-nucleotidase